MKPFTRLLALLRRLRDLGVRPDTDPEAIKYIRLCNMAVLVSFAIIPYHLAIQLWINARASLLILLLVELLTLLVLVLNRRGLYVLARMYFLGLWSLYFLAAALLWGKPIAIHYYFFVVAAAIIIISPRTKSST